jgi:hypothetical protein
MVRAAFLASFFAFLAASRAALYSILSFAIALAFTFTAAALGIAAVPVTPSKATLQKSCVSPGRFFTSVIFGTPS